MTVGILERSGNRSDQAPITFGPRQMARNAGSNPVDTYRTDFERGLVAPSPISKINQNPSWRVSSRNGCLPGIAMVAAIIMVGVVLNRRIR